MGFIENILLMSMKGKTEDAFNKMMKDPRLIESAQKFEDTKIKFDLELKFNDIFENKFVELWRINQINHTTNDIKQLALDYWDDGKHWASLNKALYDTVPANHENKHLVPENYVTFEEIELIIERLVKADEKGEEFKYTIKQDKEVPLESINNNVTIETKKVEEISTEINKSSISLKKEKKPETKYQRLNTIFSSIIFIILLIVLESGWVAFGIAVAVILIMSLFEKLISNKFEWLREDISEIKNKTKVEKPKVIKNKRIKQRIQND